MSVRDKRHRRYPWLWEPWTWIPAIIVYLVLGAFVLLIAAWLAAGP